MRRRVKSASVVIVLLILAACAKAPPNLGPQGTIAYQNLQIQRTLDLLRDAAISANEVEPPVLPTRTTREVVLYHKSAITILHARAQGWQTALTTSLDSILSQLSDKDRAVLEPYAVLVRTIVQEISKEGL